MPVRLDRSSADFDQRFAAFLAAKREVSADVEAAVRAIVDDVARRGDAALLEATAKFDRLKLDASGLRVTAAEIETAVQGLRCRDAGCAQARARPHRDLSPPPVAEGRALHRSARRRARLALYRDRIRGLYVPGGTAAYPSSVLMNAVPAKVAGVARLVMVVPSPDGKLNPLVLAAAHLGGVSEIYRVGGAQAVAALAYGTATIAPVAKIVGPGNAYVAAAKRLVFGKVGIDMIAGPSEVLVIADDTGNADWIAADLLAQAEHDASAQSILITDSARLAADVEKAVEAQLKTLPRAAIAGTSWADFGAIIMVKNLADAIPLADAIAAEHLEIMTDDPDALAAKIRNAGAVFLGRAYAGGDRRLCRRLQPRAADGALGAVLLRPRGADFMKRTSILKCGPDQLRALGPAAMTLGQAEGLDAHSRSIGLRLNLS